MATLLNALKNTPNSETENGAITFSTTYNNNLDFFALASAKRNDLEGAISLFTRAFIEDRQLALRNLFYLRDVRGGSGERNIFLQCLNYLFNAYSSDEDQDKFHSLLSFIPEYGRWKDLFDLMSLRSNNLNKDLGKYISIIRKQLDEDILNHGKGKPVSLLAKWFPLYNCVKEAGRRKIASLLCKELFNNDYITCRKTITSLRKGIVEEKMSSKHFSEINYSHVPSYAMKKYRKAFLRNDEERFTKFLEDVKQGKAKLNASVLYPHDVVQSILNASNFCLYFTCLNSVISDLSSDEIDALDAMWNSLPDYTDGENSLCVCDLSGSMFININPSPSAVSIALGIYFAEHNKGKFHNHFITFSDNPFLAEIKGSNIAEKIKSVVRDEYIGYSTNFVGVFECLLKSAVKFKIPQEEMPKRIYVISDMEFNEAGNNENTNFEYVKRMYEEAGYEMPTMIFWNVASRGYNVPVSKNEQEVVLVSGCSPSVLKLVFDGTTPEEFMLSVLNSERYSRIVW